MNLSLNDFTQLVTGYGYTRPNQFQYEWVHETLPKITITLDHAYQPQWNCGIRHGSTLAGLGRTIEAYVDATARFEKNLNSGEYARKAFKIGKPKYQKIV